MTGADACGDWTSTTGYRWQVWSLKQEAPTSRSGGSSPEGLVEKKVNVTLFATADSVTKAKLGKIYPRPYSEGPTLDVKVWECLHISEVFKKADKFNLIHNHFDFLPLSYSKLVRIPVVTTIYGFSSERILLVYKKYNGMFITLR